MVTMSGRTHIGLVRKNNEDDYYCDGRNRYFIIADGIGGHANGHEASMTAVAALRLYLEAHNELSPLKRLEQGFLEANKTVHALQEELSGRVMGTTLTACFIEGSTLYFGHIGDSRGYVFYAKDHPIQFTEDHTYLQELARRDPERYSALLEDQYNLNKNTLMRAIGPDEHIEPQFGSLTIHPGDMVALMTDGLYGNVSLEEMHEIINYTDDLDEICLRFEQIALERGGKDNITVVIYEKGQVG